MNIRHHLTPSIKHPTIDKHIYHTVQYGNDGNNTTVKVNVVSENKPLEKDIPSIESVADSFDIIKNRTHMMAQEYYIDRRIMPFRDEKIFHHPDQYPPGNIAFVDATQNNQEYNLTQLLLEGQKIANFSIVKNLKPLTNEMMIIIYTKTEIDLVKLFELPIGLPFMISLPFERLDEVMEKLEETR